MGKVTIKTNAAFDRVLEAIKQLDNASVRVGWFKGAQYPDGPPVAVVAAVQNNGSIENGIPARPFMQPTIDRDSKKWQNIIKKGVPEIASGKLTAEQLLSRLGQKAQQGVQESIEEVHTPILADSTIDARARRKGQSVEAVSKKPLQDTNYMHGTVNHEVKI